MRGMGRCRGCIGIRGAWCGLRQVQIDSVWMGRVDDWRELTVQVVPMSIAALCAVYTCEYGLCRKSAWRDNR